MALIIIAMIFTIISAVIVALTVYEICKYTYKGLLTSYEMKATSIFSTTEPVSKYNIETLYMKRNPGCISITPCLVKLRR